MKYAHVLNKQLIKYAPYIQKKCLNYKYWKKSIKTNSEYVILYWKTMIHEQCKKLDKFLFKSNNVIISILNTCISNNLNTSLIDTISCINLNTLYKICKKLQKKLSLNSLEFLNDIIKERRYKFFNILGCYGSYFPIYTFRQIS